MRLNAADRLPRSAFPALGPDSASLLISISGESISFYVMQSMLRMPSMTQPGPKGPPDFTSLSLQRFASRMYRHYSKWPEGDSAFQWHFRSVSPKFAVCLFQACVHGAPRRTA